MTALLCYVLAAIILIAKPSWSAPRAMPGQCGCAKPPPPTCEITMVTSSSESGTSCQEMRSNEVTNDCQELKLKEDELKVTCEENESCETDTSFVRDTDTITVDDVSVYLNYLIDFNNGKSCSKSCGCYWGCGQKFCNVNKLTTQENLTSGEINCNKGCYCDLFNTNYSSTSASSSSTSNYDDLCISSNDSTFNSTTNRNTTDKMDLTDKTLEVNCWDEEKKETTVSYAQCCENEKMEATCSDIEYNDPSQVTKPCEIEKPCECDNAKPSCKPKSR